MVWMYIWMVAETWTAEYWQADKKWWLNAKCIIYIKKPKGLNELTTTRSFILISQYWQIHPYLKINWYIKLHKSVIVQLIFKWSCMLYGMKLSTVSHNVDRTAAQSMSGFGHTVFAFHTTADYSGSRPIFEQTTWSVLKRIKGFVSLLPLSHRCLHRIIRSFG